MLHGPKAEIPRLDQSAHCYVTKEVRCEDKEICSAWLDSHRDSLLALSDNEKQHPILVNEVQKVSAVLDEIH